MRANIFVEMPEQSRRAYKTEGRVFRPATVLSLSLLCFHYKQPATVLFPLHFHEYWLCFFFPCLIPLYFHGLDLGSFVSIPPWIHGFGVGEWF